MRYKINKFSGGGAMVATYTPIQDSSGSVNPSSKAEQPEAKKETKDVIDETIYKKLISDVALVNDVDYFVEKFRKTSQGGGDFPYLKSSNLDNSLNMIKDLNRLRNYKEDWTNATKTAQTLGGYGEVAVGKQGELFVKTKEDGFKTITVSEYKANRDQYQALTVAELMRARQFDPSLVHNEGVFQVGETAHGMNKILKKVDDIINIVEGDRTKTEGHFSRESLMQKLSTLNAQQAPNRAQTEAIMQFTRVLGNSGNNFQVISETINKSKYADVTNNYIMDALTVEEKNKLEAVAAVKGTSTKQLIIDALTVGLSGDTENFLVSPEEDARTKGTSGSQNPKSLTAFQMFHKDKLFDPNSTFAFNDPKLSVLFKGSIGATGALLTEKDESIPMVTLENIVDHLGYNRFLDSSKITFGNKKVDSIDKGNIIYDGESVAKVYMPVDSNGSPDYEGFEDFKKVYALYQANKDNESTQASQNRFTEAGYKLIIDEVGGEKVIRDNNEVKPFLLMYGYTNDATDLPLNNPFATKLSSDEENRILPRLRSIWSVGTGKSIKDLTPNKSWNSEDYYKGLIAIPYRKEAAAIVDALVNQGPTELVSSYANVQRNLMHSSNLPMGNSASGNILTQRQNGN